jgi:hypothetical protein
MNHTSLRLLNETGKGMHGLVLTLERPECIEMGYTK